MHTKEIQTGHTFADIFYNIFSTKFYILFNPSVTHSTYSKIITKFQITQRDSFFDRKIGATLFKFTKQFHRI